MHARRLKNRQNSLPLIRDVPTTKENTLGSTEEECTVDSGENNNSESKNAGAVGPEEVVINNGSADKDIRITENPLEQPAAV